MATNMNCRFLRFFSKEDIADTVPLNVNDDVINFSRIKDFVEFSNKKVSISIRLFLLEAEFPELLVIFIGQWQEKHSFVFLCYIFNF